MESPQQTPVMLQEGGGGTQQQTPGGEWYQGAHSRPRKELKIKAPKGFTSSTPLYISNFPIGCQTEHKQDEFVPGNPPGKWRGDPREGRLEVPAVFPGVADILQLLVPHVPNGEDEEVFVGVHTFPQLEREERQNLSRQSLEETKC